MVVMNLAAGGSRIGTADKELFSIANFLRPQVRLNLDYRKGVPSNLANKTQATLWAWGQASLPQ